MCGDLHRRSAYSIYPNVIKQGREKSGTCIRLGVWEESRWDHSGRASEPWKAYMYQNIKYEKKIVKGGTRSVWTWNYHWHRSQSVRGSIDQSETHQREKEVGDLSDSIKALTRWDYFGLFTVSIGPGRKDECVGIIRRTGVHSQWQPWEAWGHLGWIC